MAACRRLHVAHGNSACMLVVWLACMAHDHAWLHGHLVSGTDANASHGHRCNQLIYLDRCSQVCSSSPCQYSCLHVLCSPMTSSALNASCVWSKATSLQHVLQALPTSIKHLPNSLRSPFSLLVQQRFQQARLYRGKDAWQYRPQVHVHEVHHHRLHAFERQANTALW